MEKEFIPYEQALALKELGFDEPCIRGWYKDGEIWYHPDSDIILDNPTFSQAFRWFREKYNLEGRITSWTERGSVVWYISTEEVGKPSRFKCYEVCAKTFEEAELECLKKLIEIVK